MFFFDIPFMEGLVEHIQIKDKKENINVIYQILRIILAFTKKENRKLSFVFSCFE